MCINSRTLQVRAEYKFALNYVALHAILPNLMNLFMCASLSPSEAKVCANVLKVLVGVALHLTQLGLPYIWLNWGCPTSASIEVALHLTHLL